MKPEYLPLPDGVLLDGCWLMDNYDRRMPHELA